MTSTTEFPSTCLAAVFHDAARPLQLQHLAVPLPRSGEAVIRVDLCTVCGSDLHTITGRRQEATPTIPGHEVIGTVVRVGDPAPLSLDGSALQPGDRVSWSVCVCCQNCERCRSGLTQKCLSVTKYGHELAEGHHSLSGGLAEYLLLRANSAVLRVDPLLPDEVACPANCATATVAAAIRIAGVIEGRRVAIIGAGLLGLTAAAMAIHHKAASVQILDRDPKRLQQAARFCPQVQATDSEQGPADADVILECSGAHAAIEQALAALAVGGTLVLVGSVMPTPPVALHPEQIVRRCLTIRGIHNYTADDLLAAHRFLMAEHGRFDFGQLVQRIFSLQDINEAIRWALAEQPLRIGIRPGRTR